MNSLPVYVDTTAEFHSKLKNHHLHACPHCKRVGTLLRHGYLRGYCEEAEPDRHRGWRFYCSNRGRHTGCGRTVSVMLSKCLHRSIITTLTLWKFLSGCCHAASTRSAWEPLSGKFSLESAYRIFKCFQNCQTALRVKLCGLCPPPDCQSGHAHAQSIFHLKNAFDCSDPMAAFQQHFQQHFWPNS